MADQSTGSLTITADRTGGSRGAVTVTYATTDGTAVAGTDYTATNGTLQWADGDAASKTFTVAIANSTPFSGSKMFTVTLSSPGGGAALNSPTSATVSISGSAGGATAWVYTSGIMSWAGDWSFSASANYKDTAGGPIEGPFDIAVTVTGPWGGWQPFVSGDCRSDTSGSCFSTAPYKYLVFALKPTVSNQEWHSAFASAGDTPDGSAVTVTPYGPVGGAIVGQWNQYRVPLSAFGLTDPNILKFAIQDATGRPTNLFYVDNVGFTAD